MGKGMNLGVSNVARKGKKGCIGIDNVARKIKKMWIGVGNVARLFFSGKGVLSYYGEATDLSTARYNMASVSAGDYALFCGGIGSVTGTNKKVEAYDKTLVRTIGTDMTNVRQTDLYAVSAGKYGLVVGGMANSSDLASATIEVFDENLVLSNNISLESGKCRIGVTNFKGNAMICGGYDNSTRLNTVEVFDENLTKNLYAMTVAKQYVGASSNNKYAIIAGGYTKSGASSKSTTAEAFDETFTHVEVADLDEARREPTCVSVGDFALFVGGYDSITAEAYDSNLTKVDVADIAYSSYSKFGCAEVEGYAIIFNAKTTGATPYVKVFAYDELLVQTELTAPTDKRGSVAGAVVGDYALFGGGYDAKSSGASSYTTVDAYKLS